MSEKGVRATRKFEKELMAALPGCKSKVGKERNHETEGIVIPIQITNPNNLGTRVLITQKVIRTPGSASVVGRQIKAAFDKA